MCKKEGKGLCYFKEKISRVLVQPDRYSCSELQVPHNPLCMSFNFCQQTERPDTTSLLCSDSKSVQHSQKNAAGKISFLTPSFT